MLASWLASFMPLICKFYILSSLNLLGFEQEIDNFLFFVLTVVLTATTASAMAFAISARAPVTSVAIMGMGQATILQMVHVLYSDTFMLCILYKHFCYA